jgi:RimJ/RimL family protein N-acetyltransferase
MNLADWKGVAAPQRAPLDGRYCRLEPLDAARHAATLFAAATAPGAEERFRYLSEEVPADLAALTGWIDKVSSRQDPLIFAVIDKATGRAEGRQSFMRIDTANGVIEIGGVMWGPAIARSRVATEALFLFADTAFRQGYRRFEWKCNALNEPSKRAAMRFGFQFEGLFRQHMVVKGLNRDTAWFAIVDGDWPHLKAGFQAWLAPENFDADGRQRDRLHVR